jgi:oligopeptide/dipeptide ABC transporter ATP-binding protein
VMYGGRVVEQGTAEQVVSSPEHPYTQLLLSAVPGSGQKRAVPATVGPSPGAVGDRTGCRFADRCPMAMEICRTTEPPAVGTGPQHVAWCHAVAAAPSSPEHAARSDQSMGEEPPAAAQA